MRARDASFPRKLGFPWSAGNTLEGNRRLMWSSCRLWTEWTTCDSLGPTCRAAVLILSTGWLQFMTSAFGASSRPVCCPLDRQTLDEDLLFLLRLGRPPVARRGRVSAADNCTPEEATESDRGRRRKCFINYNNNFTRCEASTLRINIVCMCDTNLNEPTGWRVPRPPRYLVSVVR